MTTTLDPRPSDTEPAPPSTEVIGSLGLDDGFDDHLHVTHTAWRFRRAPWLVMILLILVTVLLVQFTRVRNTSEAQARFEASAEQAVGLVEERLRKYEVALRGGIASIALNRSRVSNEEWKVFADTLDIVDQYPGAHGIGVIHHVELDDREEFLARQQQTRPDFTIHPEHNGAELLPITYIEPAQENREAVGLDMAHEANRYSALQRARTTGLPQITGPINLVQAETEGAGFLLYAPWYFGVVSDDASREQNFGGAVYMPFVFTRLMHGSLNQDSRTLRLRVKDRDAVLFDELRPGVADFDPEPMFTGTILVPVYGRSWTFEIWSTQSFADDAADQTDEIILLGGLGVSVLVFAFMTALTASNRRAEAVGDELERQGVRLHQSNTELEQFASVASHDLRTPLRGIDDLAEYLQEDLADYMSSPDANPDVRHNLDRIRHQVGRSNEMISGILDYARIGNSADASRIDDVGVAVLVNDLRVDLGLDDTQLRYFGPAQISIRRAVHFIQVLQNLVSNARNHHDDPDNIEIRVEISRERERWIGRVSDNGPGIDPRYHDRVFGVFEQLKNDGSGTGIGLPIAKKIVEQMGGQLRLESEVGHGSTFHFDWPVARLASSHDAAATAFDPEIER
ncbi:MAG: hypothetical protein HKN26_13030 [Acidimicrobiales bacterium]|nr:hypothetical protein [Acidimicrobiales bacterium]